MSEAAAKPTILVVDDERSVLETIAAMLDTGEFSVWSAFDTQVVYEILSKRPIDLLVTDIMMPETHGLSLIRDVRLRFPHAKIIAVTGALGEWGDRFLYDAEAVGADATLVKPVHTDQLLDCVYRLLEMQNSETGEQAADREPRKST